MISLFDSLLQVCRALSTSKSTRHYHSLQTIARRARLKFLPLTQGATPDATAHLSQLHAYVHAQDVFLAKHTRLPGQYDPGPLDYRMFDVLHQK